MVQFRVGELFKLEDSLKMAGLDFQSDTASHADDRASEASEDTAPSVDSAGGGGGMAPASDAGSGGGGASGAAVHAASAVAAVGKEHKEGGRMRTLKKSFRTLSAVRKTEKVEKNEKDKNEPSRFLGEGVSFKAKLIGILEVSEARGDRMCQEALADLKMAIRAAGEHKQRININIAIDGLRLRDEKTGDCLYHHPVHKISFIAQDMSDSRAFGYIFGSPDTGHRFFGIKTDKAASQVVIAMRDLFQVVFELKKKEIELAKQHIEQTQIKLGTTLFVDSASSSKNGGSSSDQSSSKMRTIQEDSVKENGTGGSASKSSQPTSEVIADLLDLEFELNSIQQGIHQMERITPSDPFGPSTKEDPFATDPFGDSFTPTSIFLPPKSTKQHSVAILPPPPSAKDTTRGSDPFNAPSSGRHTLRRTSRPSPATTAPEAAASAPVTAAATSAAAAAAPVNTISKPLPAQAAPVQQQEKHWFDQETESLFDEGELVTPPLPSSTNVPSFPTVPPAIVDQEKPETSKSPPVQSQQNQTDNSTKFNSQFDVFTELDPLGTGRVKPYVDRKDFFQELKNPPKKVLKDLVTEAPSSEATAPLFHATFDTGSSSLNVNDSVSCPSSKDVLSSAETTTTNTSVSTTTASTSTTSNFTSAKPHEIDPFKDTDPFDKTDPFAEDDFSQLVGFPQAGNSHDPFDTGFADFTMFGRNPKKDLTPSFPDTPIHEVDLKRSSPHQVDSGASSSCQPTLHGPLRVSLPPEKTASEPPVPLPPYLSASATPQPLSSPSGSLTKGKSRPRLPKQTSLTTGMVKLPSPKSSRRSSRLMKQITVDGSNTIQSSPTPQIPTTPSHSDRKSPSNQGILESVTLRNRSVVTPSPPIVACFPDISDLDSSRLSGSSAELSEIAPEPPPRPATNITPIKPPPLPPKRQQVGNMMKPPPRPPHSDHPHYDYIENYETSISPTPQEIDDIKSPPIPVPARRPRFGDADLSEAPQRPRRQYQSTVTISEPDYLPPIPILPPPQKKSPATDSSKNLTASKSRTPVMTTIASILESSTSSTTTPATDHNKQPVTAKSLNITLSQLTKTGLSDLAAALGVSPAHLSNMTLQDLTKCLSKIQSSDNSVEEIKTESAAIKRDKYDALRESVDEETEFKADFETNFETPAPTTEKLEDVFQETPFDKYAVFRELIVQVKDSRECSTELPVPEAEPSSEAPKLEEVVETTKLSVEEERSDKPPEDRYAALREISLGVNEAEKEDVDTSSDKEDGPGEVIKHEDDVDLLSLSRQQSEGTESPTLEAPLPREPQSIIESTIFEEDINALEAETRISQEQEQFTEVSKKESLPDISIINTKEEKLQYPIDQSTKSPEPTDNNKTPLEKKQEETLEGWAKFDTGSFPQEKPASEGHSEGVVSPWSSDSKEFNKSQSKHSPEKIEDLEKARRRRSRRPANWHEDDESEEGWDERRPDDAWEKPWRENGWSDGESFYDDMPPYKDRMYYYEERRGRRRRVSPWKHGQRSSRDPSPWEQEGKDDEDENWNAPNKRWQERSVDDEEEDEDYEVSWRSRPKHRGSSWDDERHRRYGNRDLNGSEYEDRWKRRPSPWSGGIPGGPGSVSGGGTSVGGGSGGGGGSCVVTGTGNVGGGNGTGVGVVSGVGGETDRRSSWESGSWDEEERFARECSERRYRGERDEWRKEYELDSRYSWGRRYGGPDDEYIRHDQPPRRKHRYYRDRSRESPWEDEYSEQGEDESPRYPIRKRNWPKRPSSASEMRRNMDKTSPGEYKARMMEKQQHSLPNVPRSDAPDKVPPYSFTDRRYRDKSGSRPRSREGHFGSDQEYDYWPQERPRRPERESYEQRSQTLHPRRPPRHKKSGEWSYSQKSPFDDDFSMQAFEFADPSKKSGEPEGADLGKNKSPILSSTTPPLSGLSVSAESSAKSKDTQVIEDESKSKDISSTSLEHPNSPIPEDQSKTRASRGSSHRQSPFEDDFTPPESRHTSGRLISSISSDISDHRRSPFEDSRGSCRVQSVVEENECESEFEHKNGKVNDDVFLPPDSATETVESVGDQTFTDLESSAFNSSVSEVQSISKPTAEIKRVEKRLPGSLWNSEETNKSEKHYTGMKVRMLLRADSSSSLRKSESINIFARESDPFDDEFFSTSDVSSTLPRPKSEQGRTTEKSSVNNNNTSDPFNWTKAFDSFNFEEDK